MDPVTWCILGGVALATATATYFATRYASNSDNEQLHEHINNQILIAKEQDNSHEFSQTIILVIVMILLIAIILYWCAKCIFGVLKNQLQQQPQALQMQPIPNAHQIHV